MKTIVLTGGPHAGKTVVSKALDAAFRGRVIRVPEVATMLLKLGFPRPGRDLAWSQQWQDRFQTAVFHVQLQLEESWKAVASERNTPLLLCDRGLLDGAAYTRGDPRRFCDDFGIDYQAALARYDLVIHLQSYALIAPDDYGRHGNPDRFEVLPGALELEERTRRAWGDHSNRIVVPPAADVREKIARVTDMVEALLS